MLARAFAFCFLVAAALTDSSGSSSGAFYFLLAAAPAIGVGGLMALAELADARGVTHRAIHAVQTLFSFLALALVIVVASSSSGSFLDVRVPSTAASALVFCLGVFVAQAALGLFERALRRPPGLYVRAGEDFVTAERTGL